jgi:hypothetical protein
MAWREYLMRESISTETKFGSGTDVIMILKKIAKMFRFFAQPSACFLQTFNLIIGC